MPFARSDDTHPITLPDGTLHRGTVFLSAVLEHPRIEVGVYSYMSSHEPLEEPAEIASRLAPYLYPTSPERLVIGKFCQIAHGVQFVTASANHRHDGLSSFPFAVFDRGSDWTDRPSLPGPGSDTIVGDDVWLGTGAMILPGAQIGSGAIIGAGAVVSGQVAPYTIVAGNPARRLRTRLAADKAARMIALAWWDWPIETILANEAAICGDDLAKLEQIASSLARPDA